MRLSALCLVFSLFCTSLDAQCTITSLFGEEIAIPDEDTVTIRLFVSAANEIDLAGFQSICAIDLDFDHRNLSDLTFELYSPVRDTSILIGPAIPGGTNSAGLPINHDISILSESTFGLEVWTNLIQGWGTLSSYTGEFASFGSDFGYGLDDRLDYGPVTGVWELRIIDHFLNDDGTLNSFSITFCEDAGLVCGPCEPRSGMFIDTDTTYICVGASYDPHLLYQDATNLADYTDVFIVYNALGQAVASGDIPDLSTLGAGDYTVRAVNIISAQADSLSSMATSNLTELDFDALAELISSPGGLYCMDLSNTTTISIREPIIDDQTVLLCVGESLVLGDRTISDTGVFRDTVGLCDTIKIRRVITSALQASFPGLTVSTDCISGNVVIGPTVTGALGEVQYEWRRVGDPNVILQDSSLNINTAELWSVHISDDQCDTTLQIESLIAGEGFSVALKASPAEFNCSSDTSVISFQAFGFNPDSVFWYLDGQLLGRDIDSIIARSQGVYSADIYGSGCMLRDDVTISASFAVPQATVNAPDISCTNGGILATINTNDPLLFSTWTDTNGDTLSRSVEIGINTPGTYDLTLVGMNFCDTTITFQVDSDDELPIVDDVPSGDITLNCDNPTLSINPSIDGAEVSEDFWIVGVSDTMRGVRDLTIDAANAYRYIVVGDNGCISATRIDVSLDTISPRLEIVTDSITCDRSEAEILVRNLGANERVEFINDHIVSRTDSTVLIDQPSTIEIILTEASNGCSSRLSTEISVSDDIPLISLEGDSMLTCFQPQARLTAGFDANPPTSFFWTLPDGQRVDDQSFVVDEIGEYVFEATGANGCVFTDTWTVTEEISEPSFDVPDLYIVTCSESLINIDANNTSASDSVVWIIDQDTINSPTLSVFSRASSLELIVVGENGCSDGTVIDIAYDTLGPVFSLVTDTIDCNNTTVTIGTDAMLGNHSFTWAGPGVGDFTSSSVEVSEPGAYALNVVDLSNGCAALQAVEVFENLEEPTFTTFPVDVITCNQSSVNVSVATSTSNDVEWLTSDGRSVDGPKILASADGQQLFTIIGSNGCITMDSIEVFSDIEKPRVNLNTNLEISCEQDTILIIPDYVDQAVQSLWTFSDGTRVLGATQLITDDKLERLTVTGVNGCETTLEFDISLATDVPSSVINETEVLSCTGNPIQLNTNTPVSANHRTIWFREDVLLGTDVLEINAATTGAYILQVIDTTSGCDSRDTMMITVAPDPLQEVEVNIQDETCLGEDDGFITVSSITGGTGDVDIYLDGSSVSIGEQNNKFPGTYTLEVVDEIGCDLINDLVLMPGEFISIDIGSDISIERGEKVSIIPTISGGPYTEIIWQGNQGTFVEGIDSLCFVPSVDERIIVSVMSASGCVAVDSLDIEVFVDISNISAYVPNILNLNSTEGNHVITIDLPVDIVELSDFSIFDRWGQQVAYADRITRGTPIIVWDGRMDGTEVTSGVYVYKYEMLTIYDDLTRTRKGDITIIK